MSITKNRQSPEALQALCSAAFPDRAVSSFTELTEGMFNAAYRIDFTDGSASVLKIAAADAKGLMSNEINLMQAEVRAMELLRAHGIPHVARVQYADFTHTLCSGSYFFMECLPGRSLNSIRKSMSEDEIDHILHQAGQFQRQQASIYGDSFGLLGDQQRFPTLHGLIRFLFENVLKDASAMNIDFGFTAEELLRRLTSDHVVFDEVSTPALVHWDMWEGNIFVQHGELSGVIDWERAMWGEAFMDDRFQPAQSASLLLEGLWANRVHPCRAAPHGLVRPVPVSDHVHRVLLPPVRGHSRHPELAAPVGGCRLGGGLRRIILRSADAFRPHPTRRKFSVKSSNFVLYRQPAFLYNIAVKGKSQ